MRGVSDARGRDLSHAVVVGASRAGTTALFSALGRSPFVTPAMVKELRFFLPREFALPRVPGAGGGYAAYRRYFDVRGPERLGLEATPDYSLWPKALLGLNELLPDARILFALRAPRKRLLSWFRYGKRIGQVAPSTSFDAFVRAQIDNVPKSSVHPSEYAVQSGLYTPQVHRLFDIFGEDRVHVLIFEEDIAGKQALGVDVLEFLGIPHGEGVVHPSMTRTNVSDDGGPFVRIDHRFSITYRTRSLAAAISPRVLHAIRRLRSQGTPVTSPPLRVRGPEDDVPVCLSSEVIGRLDEIYSPDALALRALLGRNIPW
jgi:hypothetical protein